jgi:hypothetical protein
MPFLAAVIEHECKVFMITSGKPNITEYPMKNKRFNGGNFLFPQFARRFDWTKHSKL